MKRVVLIGAGHAHLVVLRSLAEKPLYNARIALVSPHAKQVYSGMLPGILAGHYRRAEAEVDIAALAERGQVEFVPGKAQRLDPDKKTLTLESGEGSGYDIASINAGSLVGASLPGAERALPVKPYEEFLSRLRIPERVAIVGAGAAGAEIAMALRHRGAQVTLYSENASISARVVRQLRRRKVDYRPGMPVTAIEPGPLVITGLARQEFDCVVLATGAAPLPWLRQSGLRTCARGFVLVDSTLRSVSHPEVFAAGDCATLADSPHPKSGVYAVRHGEALIENLRRRVAHADLEPYAPQEKALALITCGARYAIAEHGEWSAQGRWVWWWKDRIDRRWIRSFL
ncbi:MAG TPA: FAD-dependent oxidoreductase [Burkholderiales bacterium]|nr:FAD-dependent oxidoreductase [Burkholderiales bacterium]